MIRNSLSDARHLSEVPARVVRSLRAIDLAQGRLDRLADDAPVVADALAVRSRIESVIASNELEGIRTSRDRAERVVREELEPATRDEHELAGYRAALDDVYSRPHDGLSVPRLLHWHRELFRHAGPDVAGRFKVNENRVLNPDGTDRFKTVAAAEVETSVGALVDDTNAALARDVDHPVLVAAAFTLDLLVIHPFDDGNGRTARIASNAILVGSNYGIGRLTSIEQTLAERRHAYYESLRISTELWHDGRHSVWPWAEFFCGVIADAYATCENRLALATSAGARDVVVDWLRRIAPTTFTFGEARAGLAGIPDGTVRRVLREMRELGALALDGAGRGSKWTIRDRRLLV